MLPNGPVLTDEMLMVRYKRGDREAFSLIVRRYEQRLFTFAFRYVRDREVAREVTQEAFLRVVKAAGEFRHEARFSAWIFSMLRNLCVDELRRSQNRPQRLIGSASEGPALEPVAATRNGEEGATLAELRHSIQKAVDDLPEDQREVFLLREVAELPFAEIAQITGATENTTKSRMRYALERLQRLLEADVASERLVRSHREL